MPGVFVWHCAKPAAFVHALMILTSRSLQMSLMIHTCMSVMCVLQADDLPILVAVGNVSSIRGDRMLACTTQLFDIVLAACQASEPVALGIQLLTPSSHQ